MVDNRQIKPGKNNKYNLNFIDWNNEWERVCEIENKIENNEYISDEEEKNRVLEYLKKENEKNGINTNYFKVLSKKDAIKLIKNIKLKNQTSDFKSTECYICFNEFKESQNIIKLPCLHLFHSNCLTPWLKSNHNCPTCKIDLSK